MRTTDEFFAREAARLAAMGPLEALLRDAATMAGSAADGLRYNSDRWHALMLRLESAADTAATPALQPPELQMVLGTVVYQPQHDVVYKNHIYPNAAEADKVRAAIAWHSREGYELRDVLLGSSPAPQ